MSAARPEEMSCRELVEVITDYLEGALGPDDRRRFEAHLAACPYCLTYLDQTRARAELEAALPRLRRTARPARPGRAFAVTAAGPGVGVTTVATNLAFALAAAHRNGVALAELGAG